MQCPGLNPSRPDRRGRANKMLEWYGIADWLPLNPCFLIAAIISNVDDEPGNRVLHLRREVYTWEQLVHGMYSDGQG